LNHREKTDYDVIIIGAGHNGLTAGAVLAKKGRKVLLLEQCSQVGGLAAREEFHSGYTAPGVLHDTSGVRHGLIQALDLRLHGLKVNPDPPSIYAPQRKGKGLLLHHDPERAAAEIGLFSTKDAEGYKEFRAFVNRVRPVVNGVLDNTPPQLFDSGGGVGWQTLRRAWSVRRLGKRDMAELLRIVPMCAADWLNEWFETDLLKALLAGPSVYGTFMGPRSPGSALNLLIWECRKGPLVVGGAGALVDALQRAAKAYGADIRTNAQVDAITTEGGRATGVSINGGELLESKFVIATCDPKQTLLDLLPSGAINETLEHRMGTFRARGTTAKVNVALDKRIQLAGRPGEPVEMVRTGESLDELEQAFDPVKYGRYHERPSLDIYIPAITDSACAPEGHSVLSVLVHFVPYHLKGRWNYRERESLGAAVVATLSAFAPGIEDSIESLEVLTAMELESRYGITEGQIFHGEHALDQLLIRPTPECARYGTPVEGLYMCGSGSHPGGGLTCAPGALGARAVLTNS